MNHAMGPVDVLAAAQRVAGAELDPTLAIYIHVPFCSSKCHFCDWVTDIPVRRLRGDEDDRSPYVRALCEQIRFYGPQLTQIGYKPDVMYFGGGTPTRLGTSEFTAVWQALNDSFDISGLRQWSVETTPNNVNPELLTHIRGLGATRISLGIQSLNPDQLRRAGRGHSREQALASIGMIRDAGYEYFNTDLISSFPGESRSAFVETIDTLLAYEPPHVSVYPYRATPKTVMAMQLEREVIEAYDRSSMVEFYEIAMEHLWDAGYYEYCHGYWVKSADCEDHDGNYKYNLTGDKIGFGSGAESTIGHHLLWNENTEYDNFLAGPRDFSAGHKFTLDEPERLTALIGGALMTREGIVHSRLHRLTGLEFADIRATDFFRRWFALVEECGGQLIETGSSTRLEPETVHRSYITMLAHSMSHGLTPERA